METTLVQRMLAKYGRSCELITYTTSLETTTPWLEGADKYSQLTTGIFLKEYKSTSANDPSNARYVCLGPGVTPSRNGQIRIDSLLWKIRDIQPITKSSETLAYILTVVQ